MQGKAKAAIPAVPLKRAGPGASRPAVQPLQTSNRRSQADDPRGVADLLMKFQFRLRSASASYCCCCHFMPRTSRNVTGSKAPSASDRHVPMAQTPTPLSSPPLGAPITCQALLNAGSLPMHVLPPPHAHSGVQHAPSMHGTHTAVPCTLLPRHVIGRPIPFPFRCPAVTPHPRTPYRPFPSSRCYSQSMARLHSTTQAAPLAHDTTLTTHPAHACPRSTPRWPLPFPRPSAE